MIKTYHKTSTIKAEQFDGSDEMIKKYHILIDNSWVVPYRIETMEGWLGVKIGDWIASGVEDENWPIADDVFKKTYVELSVVPKEVADWIDKCKKDMMSICWAMDEQNLPKKVADYFRNYYTREQWIKIQDTFSRAWLDGYVVEE